MKERLYSYLETHNRERVPDLCEVVHIDRVKGVKRFIGMRMSYEDLECYRKKLAFMGTVIEPITWRDK